MHIAKRLLGFKSLVLIVSRESESWDPLAVPLRTRDLIDRGEDVGWGQNVLKASLKESKSWSNLQKN